MTTVDITTGEIVPVPVDPIAALEAAADPGEFIVQACGRAKEWLTQALAQGEIEQIINIKTQAEMIRVYTMQKQLGLDSELAAAEIVRRAERGIGVAIRKGQEAGEIAKRGDIGAPPPPGGDGERPDAVRGQELQRPTDFAPEHELSNAAYPLADPTDDEFDEAIDKAKAEGNLSRANVKRKLKGEEAPFELRWDKVKRLAAEGYTSRQIASAVNISDEAVRAGCKRQNIDLPADKHVAKSRRVDHDRIVSTAVSSLEGIVMGLDLVDVETLDPDQIDGWATSMRTSLTALNRFSKQLKEMTQ